MKFLFPKQISLRSLRVALPLCMSLAAFSQTTAGAPSLVGYTAQGARTELQWEKKFQGIPSTDRLRANMQRLAARPHNVGSPYDKDNAEWMLQQFKSWGLDAHIETFYVLFPTPKERVLQLIEPTQFTAKLHEPPVPGDPTSGQQSEQLPTYNAYSPDGDVTGRLVYVNHGNRDDYKVLDRLGISVKGAIVIARYGGGWRGIKPKVAAEHGAIGCIIYSDPHDDGFSVDDAYPKGSGRPDQGVQRGAVTDDLYEGDPLTPGWGSTKDAKRLPIREAKTIAKIPTLPISYGDAQPLLAAIGGPVAPPSWRGGLGITYHIGPGPAKVHLKLAFNWNSMTPIYDVIAKIPGSTEPDEWVIRGNHHDGWVNGAQDPIAGMSPVLEEARAFGELLKQGWKPRRTIIYCAWDGEEPGLLGSTEWVETHMAELQKHAVMYVNSDTNDRGFLHISGSHSLEHFINGVAKDVPDPEKNMSVWERAKLVRIARAKDPAERAELRQRSDLRIYGPGDGSDYATFLHHAGIPILNLGFSGEERKGSAYHSIYDDYTYYSRFDDGKFVYGRALAQVAGTAVMRMADADLIPYDFTDYAETIHHFLGELNTELISERAQIKEQNKEIAEGVFNAISDPQAPIVPPSYEKPAPFLNFAPLENSAATFTHAADEYQKALTKMEANGGAELTSPQIDSVNDTLITVERAFLNPNGLPGRPYFKHMIYAPGMYTGYGVKTIPGVREALEQHQWPLAEKEADITGTFIDKAAGRVTKAAEQLDAIAGKSPASISETTQGGR
ncbi:MAG: transferrin receptor-like dimerization domain-containing protein [Acidobacteriaceae bacterium]